MEHQNAAIRVGYLFNFDAKTNPDEQIIGCRNKVGKCRTTHHWPGRLVGNTKQKRSTALISYGNAISR